MFAEMNKNSRWTDDDQIKYMPPTRAHELAVAASRNRDANRHPREFQSVRLKKKPPAGASM
jgi:hypothetical protein